MIKIAPNLVRADNNPELEFRLAYNDQGSIEVQATKNQGCWQVVAVITHRGINRVSSTIFNG